MPNKKKNTTTTADSANRPVPADKPSAPDPGCCGACGTRHNPARYGVTTVGAASYFACESCGARNPIRHQSHRPAAPAATR